MSMLLANLVCVPVCLSYFNAEQVQLTLFCFLNIQACLKNGFFCELFLGMRFCSRAGALLHLCDLSRQSCVFFSVVQYASITSAAPDC